MSHKIWIVGEPSVWGTAKEKPWRELLLASLKSHPPYNADGIILKFTLTTLAPNNQPLDLDNLCEPVFSVLINNLGWFGGKRPNLKWWRAEKKEGSPAGLQIEIPDSSSAPAFGFSNTVFQGEYSGPLPRGGSSPEIPEWLNTCNSRKVIGNERLALSLQFGDPKVNIGDAASRVKSVIDCLYPIIGGKSSAPEDWKIDALQVEKRVGVIEETGIRIKVAKV